jgi:hypothetical protein
MGRINDCADNPIGNSLITVLGSLNSANIDFDLVSIIVINIRVSLI